MKEKTRISKQYGFLFALAVLGDAVLILPGKGSGQYLFLGAVTAFLASFLLCGVLIALCNLVLRNKEKTVARIAIGVSSVPVVVYALWNGVVCGRRFVAFAAEILLPHTPKVWIVLIFAAVVLYLSCKPNQVLLKLSLLSGVVCLLTVLLVLILSGKDFKISNIAVYSVPGFGTLAKESIPFFKSVTFPVLLLPLYQAVSEKRISFGVCFGGLAAGGVLLIACFAECLLLFGVALSARFPYPLYAAVSTVTVGPLFTRMDGAVYGLFFLTALLKSALCFRLAVLLPLRLGRGRGERKRML